ncbi:TetR/AcrR family transcriptional regulator [Gordonia sp. (in: high G+C Gram-positive bacteria)]|uniref:TetR/AcrR family transcriptional regulator n=1 Tax=Gordonia sp. (in: high G+C Gram-positive bacteria) TaxID=84139 RepID=UPI0039E60D19
MTLNEPEASRTRRRGDELENALLDAAWDELEERGVAAFTFDAVAKRARTSRPVLYRRWPTREDLIIAAIRHYSDQRPVEVPDTGSLRGDLLELLHQLAEQRTGLAVPMVVQLGNLYESGITMAQAREQLIQSRTPSDTIILERADARGEIDLAKIPPAVRSLPLDLWRHHVLMTFGPIDDDYARTIVDDIFLPLAAYHSAKD